VRPNHQKPEPAWSYSICVKFKIERSTRFQARKKSQAGKMSLARFRRRQSVLGLPVALAQAFALDSCSPAFLSLQSDGTWQSSPTRTAEREALCCSRARRPKNREGSSSFRERASTVRRLAMRYVRRGRAFVTLGSLLHGSPSGQRYLTKFVMERLSVNHTTRNL